SVERIARVQHALRAHPIPASLLDLVVIAMVREQGLVGFVVRPVAHYAASMTMRGSRITDCSSSRRSSSSRICGDDGNRWPGYIASISGSRLGKRGDRNR